MLPSSFEASQTDFSSRFKDSKAPASSVRTVQKSTARNGFWTLIWKRSICRKDASYAICVIEIFINCPLWESTVDKCKSARFNQGVLTFLRQTRLNSKAPYCSYRHSNAAPDNECLVCQSRFFTAPELEEHIQRVHVNNEGKFYRQHFVFFLSFSIYTFSISISLVGLKKITSARSASTLTTPKPLLSVIEQENISIKVSGH